MSKRKPRAKEQPKPFLASIPIADDTMIVAPLANQYANEAHNTAVGPNHLLLAMLRRPSSGLVELIQITHLDVEHLNQQLRQSMKPDAGWREFVVLPQSPAAKQVWKFAESELTQFGHSKIGMEHLLLALVWNEANVVEETDKLRVKQGLEEDQDEPTEVLTAIQRGGDATGKGASL